MAVMFDTSLLDVDARMLWYREATVKGGPEPVTVADLLSFAYLCTLELGPIPEAVERALREHDPEHQMATYFDRLREARFPHNSSPGEAAR